MAFEWVAGLFQSEEARGLSGESTGAVALDDSNPYYNYRLRRHIADGDIVNEPSLIWYTSPYVNQRQGLGTHVEAETGEGIANYTDVLVVLSADDYNRSKLATEEPWAGRLNRVMQQEFENFCRRENFRRPHAHRPMGIQVLCDGSPEMDGLELGLKRGEFISGLLPNLYTGPVFGSFPVIGVHVNLPGVWEGYREVGRLHNDQILFTLGNHWLDNFSHPALQEAALYRLQQYPDGSFVHIVNPDLQNRYVVTSTTQDNTSVLTIATREGEPVAYLVLGVKDPPSSSVTDAPPPAAAQPGISMPAMPGRAAFDPIPSVAPPMLIDGMVQPVPSPRAMNSLGGKTIIPDAPSERIFTLQERGALLQKVHFSAFMLGYDVFLGSRGEMGTKVARPAATFQVRKRTISLLAIEDNIIVAGQRLPVGTVLPIEGDIDIEIAGQKFEYRDLRANLKKVAGWPYVGEIRRPASSTYLIWGEQYVVGRSRECRVVLPDQTSNDNIHWKPKVGDGAYIRARTGDIPKSNFYTDSIMVSSEHGSIDLTGDQPSVNCNASHCYVFVRRNGELVSLHPTSHADDIQSLGVEPGDEVLIGNCLFHVGFTPGDEAIAAAPAPKVEFSADSLADAVDLPGFDSPLPPPMVATPAPVGRLDFADEEDEEDEEDDATAIFSAPKPLSAVDAPMAGGLGEGGMVPRPISIERLGADSIIGDDGGYEDMVADGPTLPGMPIPILENESESTFNSELSDADAAESPPLVDESLDAPGWDEDDHFMDTGTGLDDDAPIPSPIEPFPSAVPTPFPDLTDTPESASRFEEVPAPPAPVVASTGENTVIFTDDAEAQFELGRPVHIILAGWMVNGEAVIGNHTGADLILPENRIVKTQIFDARDYLRLKIRGRRGTLDILARTEVLIDEGDPSEDSYDDLESRTIDIIRRDDTGEEDFAIRLTIGQDRKLPDPRARFISLDYEDPLAAALITRGLPKGQDRTIAMAGINLTFFYDGDAIRVSNYLDTYKKSDGSYHPFFVQSGGKRFKTAPEDGTPFTLSDGDRIVIGQAVYVVREE